jgi:O-antigen ligase/tetratricopeptide (TPR) repeat protein
MAEGDRGPLGSKSTVGSLIESRPRPLTLRQLTLAATLLYFVLIGGTNVGTYVTAFAALNGVIASLLVGVWLYELPRNNDLTDRLLLVGLLLFLAACVISAFPRMSFDAATSSVAFLAAFGIARGELLAAGAERAMITALAVCGAALAIVILAVWIPDWVQWWQAMGTAPPLDRELPSGPYRGFHVVGMLIGVLLPALVQAGRRRSVGPAFLLAAVASLAVIYMSGSRSNWLAVLAVAAGAMVVKFRPSRRFVVGASALALVVLTLLAASGALEAISARLLNTYTIATRVDIWQSAIRLWQDRPLAGWGPGSFAATFTYGESFPLSPRLVGQAHNVAVQAILEAGLLGLAALVVVVAGLAIAIARNKKRSGYALAGLTFFAVVGLTDMPTNHPMVIAIVVCWAACAAPRYRPPGNPKPRGISWPAALSAVLGLATAAAVGSTLAATTAFNEARNELAGGDVQSAEQSLDRAVSFDPSMALYWRERGILHVRMGNVALARLDLERALKLNGRDVTTLRGLAVLAVQEGRRTEALTLAERAAELQGTWVSNQVLLAWVATQLGSDDVARRAMADVLTWYPWISASPTWTEVFDSPVDAPLRRAAAKWAAQPPQRQVVWQSTWLMAMTDGPPAGRLSPVLEAIDAIIRCQTERAAESLAAAGRSVNEEPGLTALMMLARVTNDEVAYRDAVRPAYLWRGELGLVVAGEPAPASAFSDYDYDTEMYDRIPFPSATIGPYLPTSVEGLAQWIHDPRSAARRGAPGSDLANCGP